MDDGVQAPALPACRVAGSGGDQGGGRRPPAPEASLGHRRRRRATRRAGVHGGARTAAARAAQKSNAATVSAIHGRTRTRAGDQHRDNALPAMSAHRPGDTRPFLSLSRAGRRPGRSTSAAERPLEPPQAARRRRRAVPLQAASAKRLATARRRPGRAPRAHVRRRSAICLERRR